MNDTNIITYVIIFGFALVFIVGPIIGAVLGVIQVIKHPAILDTIDWFRENLPKQWVEIKKACEGFKCRPRS